MKIQTILPLALASLVFGCGGQLSSDEAGLLDAVAFVTGGQEEGAIPQGFETRWRRTVHGDATSEVGALDFNKVRRFDIEDGDSPNVVIEGSAWMCKQGGCQDIVTIGISAPRQQEARAIESKRHAIDFIKKACPGPFLVDRK